MRTLIIGALAVAAGLVSVGGGPVKATVLYDNLGATDTSVYGDGVSSSGSFGQTIPAGPLSNSFSTGGSDFVFEYLDLRLDRPDSPSGSITVSLLSDNSILPGSLIAVLGTIDDSAVTTSPEIIEIPVVSIDLNANTRYWIQLVGDGSDISWEYSLDASGPGVAGEYFDNLGGVAANTFGPYQMRVADTPVSEPAALSTVAQADTPIPEPATLSILGLALAGFGLMRRRQAD